MQSRPEILRLDTPLRHPRWSRSAESAEFFDAAHASLLRLRVLAAAAAALLGTLGAGLWRLREAALAPPRLIGLSRGLIFNASPQPVSSVTEEDFARQMAETVEVLFTRTDRGLPPEAAQFCSTELLGAMDRAYREAARKYPAGYAQSLALLESRPMPAPPGERRLRLRGVLTSRAAAAAQSSPVYLDCAFALRGSSPLNASGWRLVRADALSREEFYRDDREQAVRRELALPNP